MFIKHILTKAAPAAILALAAAPAMAGNLKTGTSGGQPWPGSVAFDLARDCPKQLQSLHEDASGAKAQGLVKVRNENGYSSKEELGPYFVYETGRSGPRFELAALGAGRKGNPGLAHLALGWNF